MEKNNQKIGSRQKMNDLILKQKNNPQNIKVKIIFKFKDLNNNSIPNAMFLINRNCTLMALIQKIKAKIDLKEDDGIFLFVGNLKIASLTTKLRDFQRKQITQKGNQNPFLQFNVQIMETF